MSDAFVPFKGAERPLVSADRAPRSHRTIGWTRPGALTAAGLPAWTAIWDRDTDVPLRLWGDGVTVRDSVANAAIAETAARAFLALHISTLAPGSTASDFELVSNRLDGSGTLRSVGFIQRASGLRVLGGTIGFAFKGDRLAMVSSTALPNVAVAVPSQRLGTSTIERAATRWVAEAGHTVVARTNTNASALPDERVIIPIVRPRLASNRSIAYRVAEQVQVDATNGHASWNVWIDASTADPIARKSTIHYASGRLQFEVPERGPHAARAPFAAMFTNADVGGIATTSSLDGTITWAGDAAANMTLKLTGPFARVTNKAGAGLTETITLQPDSVFTWTKATTEFEDAQLTAFIHANVAKQFAKTRFDADLPWLKQAIPVAVNEDDTCNAFSTGNSIHFFRKSNQCENTARLADVVYHEFGHSLHANAIIEGVGQQDGALGEGISDALAMAITGDPGMGRGFFFSNAPMRDLNPARDKRWPDDLVGQVHADGEIIGQTLYDLRVGLEAKLGSEAGYAAFLKVLYSAFQRASDLPTTYPEALLADDDDGDLTNGTPNQCEINAAFGKHGLADPTLSLGLSSPTREDFRVSIQTAAAAAAAACPDAPKVDGAVLDWRLRNGSGGQIAMTMVGETLVGDLPEQAPGSVVQYQVTLMTSDGSKVSYPQNRADPMYEFFVGEVTPIYCSDFESGVDAAWTRSSNDWEFGAPEGLAGDPTAAYGGAGVLGLDLSADGLYDRASTHFVESPEIDLQGHTKVRLQYRRWLNVEDGFYDQARITANGTEVWTNLASETEDASMHHTDREWRFQDIDVSSAAASGKLKLRFELQADEGLELGGWTLDDVCVVTLSADGFDADEGGGCCSTGSNPAGGIALSLVTLGALMRRRRRSRTP